MEFAGKLLKNKAALGVIAVGGYVLSSKLSKGAERRTLTALSSIKDLPHAVYIRDNPFRGTPSGDKWFPTFGPRGVELLSDNISRTRTRLLSINELRGLLIRGTLTNKGVLAIQEANPWPKTSDPSERLFLGWDIHKFDPYGLVADALTSMRFAERITANSFLHTDLLSLSRELQGLRERIAQGTSSGGLPLLKSKDLLNRLDGLVSMIQYAVSEENKLVDNEALISLFKNAALVSADAIRQIADGQSAFASPRVQQEFDRFYNSPSVREGVSDPNSWLVKMAARADDIGGAVEEFGSDVSDLTTALKEWAPFILKAVSVGAALSIFVNVTRMATSSGDDL